MAFVAQKPDGGGKKSQIASSNTTKKNNGLTQQQRDAYRNKTDQLIEEQEKKAKEYDEYLKKKRKEEEQKTYAEQTMQYTQLIEQRRQIQQLMEEAERLKSIVLKSGEDFNTGYGGSRAVLVEGYSNNILSNLEEYIETLETMDAKLAEEQSRITGENIVPVTDTRRTTERVETNNRGTMYYDSGVLRGDVLPQYDNIDVGLKQMFDNLWAIQGIGEYEGIAEYRMQALSDIENMQETNGRLKDNVKGIVDSVESVERENLRRQREIAERKTAAILEIATREEYEEIQKRNEYAGKKTAAILGIETTEEYEERLIQEEQEEQERLERQREIARSKMDQLLEEKAKREKEYEEILKQKEQAKREEERLRREQERRRRAVFFNKQNQLLGAEGNLTFKELEELADQLLGDYLEPGETYDKYAKELDQIYLRYAMEGNYSNLDKDINDLLDRISAELEEKKQKEKEKEKQKGQSPQGKNPNYYGYGTDITLYPTDEIETDGIFIDGYKAYIPDTVGTDNPPRTIIIDFHGKGGGNWSFDQIAENGLVGAIQNSDLAKPNAYILTPRVNPGPTVKDSPWVAYSSADEMVNILEEFLADQGLKREDVNIIFAGNSAGGQASLYMATELTHYRNGDDNSEEKSYCDGVIAMDAVLFNGIDTIPQLVDEGLPIYAYGGSESAGGDQPPNTEGPKGFHQEENPEIETFVGNMTYINSRHGDMPTNVYNIDDNHNGISDMLERFDFISANVGGVTKSNSQREPQTPLAQESASEYDQYSNMLDELWENSLENQEVADNTGDSIGDQEPQKPLTEPEETVPPTTVTLPTEPEETVPPITEQKPTGPASISDSKKDIIDQLILGKMEIDEMNYNEWVKPNIQEEPPLEEPPAAPKPNPVPTQPEQTAPMQPQKGTPEAIIYEAQNTRGITSNSEYICTILRNAGYLSEEDANIFKNYSIDELCGRFELYGWKRLENSKELQVGDIVKNGQEEKVGIYAGDNKWYVSDGEGVQEELNLSENTTWYAYRPSIE